MSGRAGRSTAGFLREGASAERRRLIEMMQRVPQASPRAFGEPCWRFMEAVLLGMRDRPTERERKVLLDWLVLVGLHLGCEKCSQHFTARARDPGAWEATASRGQILLWLVNVQRDVQRSMGRQAPPYCSYYRAMATMGAGLGDTEGNGKRRERQSQPTFESSVGAARQELLQESASARASGDAQRAAFLGRAARTEPEPPGGGNGDEACALLASRVLSKLNVPFRGQWGPYGWAFIAYMLLAAPDGELTPQERNSFGDLLLRTAQLLPCSACASHATPMFKTAGCDGPGTRGAYLLWLVERHNEVNKRLGNPVLTAAAAFDYFTQLAAGTSDVNRASRIKDTPETEATCARQVVKALPGSATAAAAAAAEAAGGEPSEGGEREGAGAAKKKAMRCDEARRGRWMARLREHNVPMSQTAEHHLRRQQGRSRGLPAWAVALIALASVLLVGSATVGAVLLAVRAQRRGQHGKAPASVAASPRRAGEATVSATTSPTLLTGAAAPGAAAAAATPTAATS